MEMRNCRCAIEKDLICTECHLTMILCSCNKLCSECKGIKVQYEREGIPISDYCNCQVNFIESLKTKILVDNGLDLRVEDQTSMSEILDIHLDKNCIEPPEPGKI